MCVFLGGVVFFFKIFLGLFVGDPFFSLVQCNSKQRLHVRSPGPDLFLLLRVSVRSSKLTNRKKPRSLFVYLVLTQQMGWIPLVSHRRTMYLPVLVEFVREVEAAYNTLCGAGALRRRRLGAQILREQYAFCVAFLDHVGGAAAFAGNRSLHAALWRALWRRMELSPSASSRSRTCECTDPPALLPLGQARGPVHEPV